MNVNLLPLGMAKKVPVPSATPDDWARFMARVTIQPDGCWLWQGARYEQGYGAFSVGGQTRRAHRVIYVWTHGEYEQEHLDHTCHPIDGSCLGGSGCAHRACVNPSHLQPVEPRRNTVENSLGLPGVHARKTHCKHGHLLAGDNLSPYGRGRVCEACRERRYRAAHPNPNNRDKTHCKNGHPLSGDNLVMQAHGRACRTCQQATKRRWYHAHKPQAKE